MDGTEFFHALRSQESFTCSSYGVSGNEIRNLEAQFNIALPDDYIAFLQEFGFAAWFGHAVFGISKDMPDFDAAAVTLEARLREIPTGFKPIPLDGVIVESYTGGGDYFLYSKDSKRSGEVALFVDEAGGEEVESWKSFNEFLSYLLQTSVASV